MTKLKRRRGERSEGLRSPPMTRRDLTDTPPNELHHERISKTATNNSDHRPTLAFASPLLGRRNVATPWRLSHLREPTLERTGLVAPAGTATWPCPAVVDHNLHDGHRGAQ